MPRPRNRLFSRTEPESPEVMGNAMYAPMAAMLPTMERKKKVLICRSARRSATGSMSVTRSRCGGSPGFSKTSVVTTAMPAETCRGSCFSTAEPATGVSSSCCAMGSAFQ